MSELGQLFSKPKMPKMPDATRMPDIADPTVIDAGKRKVRQEQARTGRESTNLAGAAPTYGNQDLGL